MKTPDPRRRRAFQTGLEAEEYVARHLCERGFSLLDRRFKTEYGEIDLVMRRGDLVVFLEVKARASVAEGARSISPRAQRRIARSAGMWIADRADILGAQTDFRFDVAIVTPDNSIALIEAAFEACE